MVDFDELKDRAEGLVTEHGDKIEAGIDKVADLAGDKLGHESQIDQAADKLKGLIPGGE
jgi:MT0933-like antitoxin protein